MPRVDPIVRREASARFYRTNRDAICAAKRQRMRTDPTYRAMLYKRTAQWRTKKRKQIAQLKVGKSCKDCEISYPPYVMDFDHVRGKKAFSLGHGLAANVKWKVILAEVAKCDLVCSNCHRERTFGRRKEF